MISKYLLCVIVLMLEVSNAMSQELLFGQMEPFVYPVPESATAWEEEKPILRKKLRRLLGDLPPLFTPKPLVTDVEFYDGFKLEKFHFDNRAGHIVFGYTVIPEGRETPGPAILYHHYHGGEYNNGKSEILKPWIIDKAPAKALADAGYVVVAIDAYGFGQRKYQGPAGEREFGGRAEAALFKSFIWQGKTLWGMIIRDDMLALNYLLSKTGIVDPNKVGAMGMSMGSTRTWWLSALDERIQASACVACLTRYQTLLKTGNINEHGIYYFVPDILKEKIDMEAVVALSAPRPLITLTGSDDAGSPVEGVNAINAFCLDVYSLYNASENFSGKVYDGIGHEFTPAMWDEAMLFFDKHLLLKDVQ